MQKWELFQDLIDVVETETEYQIKPKQFLGAENFSNVALHVNELGGKYHSMGKDSHFSIPKTAQENEKRV